jgi:hypothetical protein
MEEVAPQGGWIARSLSHGRKIHVNDDSQLIHRCDENGIQIVADETTPNRRSQKTAPLTPAPVPIEPERPLPPRSSLPVVKPQETTPNLLDAAAIVLKENKKQPMTARQIVETVIQQSLWASKGATPWLTLHTALSREIESKGVASRFRKASEKGKFVLR